VTEADENGDSLTTYRGEKGILNFKGWPSTVVRDDMGLASNPNKNLKTIKDILFTNDFENNDCLARCVRDHTFKDATIDGKPNPRPTVIDVPGSWESLKYKEVREQAKALASQIRAAGIEPKQKVALWAGNSVEWMLAELACIYGNFTSVSVYDTLGPDAASYIIADSGAQVVVCDDKTVKRLPSALEDGTYKENPCADVRLVIQVGSDDGPTKLKLQQMNITVSTLSEMVRLGPTNEEPAQASGTDIYTIMYTSGTTGMPKGVMLSNSNLVSIFCLFSAPGVRLSDEDVHFSYLPLAHIFERVLVMGTMSLGGQVKFASNGSKGLLPDLQVVRPTFFAGVPKVYETVRDSVKRKMTGFKGTLFDKALAAKTRDIETGCGYWGFWDTLVFDKTKAALGGRVRFCVTGGAPISLDTLLFVRCALGNVVQGYGSTETAAVSTLTMEFDCKMGNVGPPSGSCAVRLVDVPDMNYFNANPSKYTDAKIKKIFEDGKHKIGGEVWIGGPSVSTGYYDPSVNGLRPGMPSNGMKKKSDEDFFQEDGWSWFKTGDIGVWTDTMCLKIVDRKKNMFKTSLGEYVPVEEVEKTYSDSCPYVDFVFLPKETKVSYIALCCVVSESMGTVKKWAAENGVTGDENAIVSSPEFKSLLESNFESSAKAKKLQRFMYLKKENIHVEYLPAGYQESWVAGVMCPNGHSEQLLTATFKARRAQLDQYFANAFPVIYPDRPADHNLP
jgi:long-chain acyl-CoA synthetase